MNNHSPYMGISITRSGSTVEIVTDTRAKIVEEIRARGSSEEQHMVNWFTEPKWTKNDFTYCNVVTDGNNDLIALAASKVLDDNTMKVCCHLYVMKDQRSRYPQLLHTDVIPSDVEYAREKLLDGVWYSIHCFDKRHKRFAEANRRKIGVSGVAKAAMPYWEHFQHVGEVIYNHTPQEKFYLDLRGFLPA
jgi:hypothetical protein